MNTVSNLIMKSHDWDRLKKKDKDHLKLRIIYSLKPVTYVISKIRNKYPTKTFLKYVTYELQFDKIEDKEVNYFA